MTELSEHQKEALAAIARRLRQQAEELERIIRAGRREPLSRACGRLHATETLLSWLRNSSDGAEAESR